PVGEPSTSNGGTGNPPPSVPSSDPTDPAPNGTAAPNDTVAPVANPPAPGSTAVAPAVQPDTTTGPFAPAPSGSVPSDNPTHTPDGPALTPGLPPTGGSEGC